MGFLRYWGTVLASVPGLLIDKAVSRVLAGIGLVALIVLAFNRPLGEKIMSWEGISPWWAIVPMIVLFLYGLMRAIHAKHAALEIERDDLRRTNETLVAWKDQLVRERAIRRVVQKMNREPRPPISFMVGKTAKNIWVSDLAFIGIERLFDVEQIEDVHVRNVTLYGPAAPAPQPPRARPEHPHQGEETKDIGGNDDR